MNHLIIMEIKYKIFAEGAIIFFMHLRFPLNKIALPLFSSWWPPEMISQMEDHFSQNIVTEHFP